MATNYQPNPAMPLKGFGPQAGPGANAVYWPGLGGAGPSPAGPYQPPIDHAPISGGYQPSPGMPARPGPGMNGPLSGVSEQDALQQAMQALGVTGTQMRNDPAAQQRVQQYLAVNGSPGWQFGGTQAGDWAQTPSGQQVDYLSSQGDRFQWIPDPANGGGTGGGVGTGGDGGWNLSNLGSQPASPFGGVATNAPLLAPFTGQFHAPSAQDALNSPGLQFAMDEAQKALQRSAASKGTLLTGGLLKGLQGTAIGQSLQGYGDVYNRALGEFNLGRDIWQTNQGNQFNRLYALGGLGENAAAQTGAYGSAYSNNAGNLLTQQGNANAAGSLGGTLPWANAANNIGNQYLQNMYLRQLGPSNIYGQ